ALPNPFWTSPLLAQTAAADASLTSKSLQFDWPETAGDFSLYVLIALAAVFTVFMYVRDTRTLSRGWTALFSLLRLSLLAGLVVIALNPQERIQKESYRPSQVVLLVDTSTSMQQPERDPRSAAGEPLQTRSQAVQTLLSESPLIDELRRTHHVDVYTFDSDLSENQHRYKTRFRPPGASSEEASAAAEPAADSDEVDWAALLQPRGNSTRLGDSLDKLLAEVKGKTLSGVVVFSDGASNVGRGVGPANERAQNTGVRLVAVGLGGTQPPLNLQVARMIAPTDVQMPRADDVGDGEDTFEVIGYIQSQGLAGRSVEVELLRRLADDEEPTVVAQEVVTLPEGTDPALVTFEQTPERTGVAEYSLRVIPPSGVRESRDDDNLITRSINFFDEPLRILIVAGGPMRDYVFAKNALHRHKSMEVDIWLQTGTVGISQDADEILFEFPEEREDLFGYDVIVAFDPDWSQIPIESQAMMEEWVSGEGGGLILVAGDVYTPDLAAVLADDEIPQESAPPIGNLYPVLLEVVRKGIDTDRDADQAWEVGFTQEGLAADFLNLEDEPSATIDVWEEFPGVYRCYPTRGRKGGATVYAEFTNPRASGRDGQPVLLAGQRYSQGNTLYLGSPEIWRLRSIDEEYYDRFWIKLVRRAAEGRNRRGVQRAMLILEGRDYDVGQTVPIRARVLNAQFQAPETDSVQIEIYDPTGKPIIPGPTLKRDPNRPSEFVGDFLAAVPGSYRIELPVPDSNDVVASDISVTLSALEMSNLQQNVAALTQLTEGTGGAYLGVEQALERIPALLPNRGQRIIIDQQLRELWDRQWVLFLLVGLLGVEWLARKLLKLA
ncbi:MAG: VWA domain-containing protein, partial [Planctomycetota bacterium]